MLHRREEALDPCQWGEGCKPMANHEAWFLLLSSTSRGELDFPPLRFNPSLSLLLILI